MRGSIDLHPSHLTAVEHILAEHVPECEVRAFGSRATWTAKDYSDLDLAVVGGGLLHWLTLSRLQGAFEESRLPIRVDVLDWHAISERFRKVIERDYVVVQEGVKRRSATTDQQSAVQNVGQVPVRCAMTYAIGGGWGKEHPEPGTAPTRVVRGTDFSNIRDGLFDAVPLRHESVKAINRRRLQPGDIILEISGGSASRNQATGRSLLMTQSILDSLGEPVIPASFCRLVRFDPTMVDQQYVYYSLQEMYRSGRAALYQNQSTGISNFQFNYFLDEEMLRLPPLSEQRAIAHVLGTLDDKIELNRQMNETLEEMARALFKSWFVDFEPVRAKLEGRWRRGESLPGLTAEHYDLFPDRLVPSELGKIPHGWEMKELDSIASFLNGLALQKYPPNDGPTLPVIKIAQLRAGHTAGADLASEDLPRQYIVHDGDVLFSWSGSLLLDIWTGGDGALNQHLFKVTSEEYPKWLYYHWVQRHLSEFRDIAADKATTMGHIQRRHLREAITVVPDAVALEAANLSMQPLVNRSLALKLEARSLATQRDALLPKLVSGEVSVKDMKP